MADENSILGTTGKEAIPFEYQSEEQRIARKRAMAQMMFQRGLQGPRQTQMFGIHASQPGLGEHVISALQTYMGMKGQTAADQDAQDMATRMQTEQQGDLAGAASAYGTDPKEGIKQALLSKFSRVQGMGQQWQKDRQAQMLEAGKALAQGSPEAGARFIQQGQVETPIADIPNAPPVISKLESGRSLITNYDKTGKGTSIIDTPPASVTNDIKLGANADEEAIKHFNYGGAGWSEARAHQKALQSTSNILNTLDKGAKGGAGAEYAQVLRKWAQSLGAPVTDATTPTEMASMQLGQLALDKLGGKLGGQISDTDRDFIIKNSGALTTDPEALRKMLLIESKYRMQELNNLNEQSAEVAARRKGVTLPRHKFNFPVSQRNADDLDSLFAGQGFVPPPPVEPKPIPGRLRRVQ